MEIGDRACRGLGLQRCSAEVDMDFAPRPQARKRICFDERTGLHSRDKCCCFLRVVRLTTNRFAVTQEDQWDGD